MQQASGASVYRARGVKDLQKQLSDSKVASDFKASSQLQAASEAVAAAEKRTSIEVKAAEARAVQVKVSADAEVKRCRSEADRLVQELGEAKATINDYMWRCEAMQCSLRNTQQNLTAASEAAAAAERRALMDLEAADARAQDARAAAEGEMQRWREEAARLQEALAASAATVSKCDVHSSDLQQGVRWMRSESDDVGQRDGGAIKLHNNQLLQKQLMEATLEDKRLSELCLQRAVQGPQTRMPERKRCGSWGSLKYLLFGIVPASLFIFALACALSHMQLEYPQ